MTCFRELLGAEKQYTGQIASSPLSSQLKAVKVSWFFG